MDVRNWLIEWFINHTVVKRNEIEANLENNYFDLGWINSLQFIDFLTNIEDHFDIMFDNQAFQNRTFSTIEGLVNIIEEMK